MLDLALDEPPPCDRGARAQGVQHLPQLPTRGAEFIVCIAGQVAGLEGVARQVVGLAVLIVPA